MKKSVKTNKLFDKKLAFFIVVILIVGVAIVAVNVNKKEDVRLSSASYRLPIAHYKFEGDFSDASGNGNSLTSVLPTPTSSAVYDNSGKVGISLAF